MDIHGPAFMPTPESVAELDRLGDEIAELSAHLDAATARLLELIREFDARGGWANGFRSCAHWLSWRVGLDIGAARERVRVARALATLPRLARALSAGELSYAKVRAITRVATPATEERLLAVGRAGTAEHVERIVVFSQRLRNEAVICWIMQRREKVPVEPEQAGFLVEFILAARALRDFDDGVDHVRNVRAGAHGHVARRACQEGRMIRETAGRETVIR